MTHDMNDLIVKVVQMGQVIRRYRADGTLLSVPPPTLYGYLAFLRMVQAMPHLSLLQIAQATLFGNAGREDRQHISGVFGEVFGLARTEDGEVSDLMADLF
jgi:hypothetical protein